MTFRNLVAVVTLILAAPMAFAAGATKVAVLDLQSVVMMTDAGKSGMAELEKQSEYTTLTDKLENLETEYKGLDEELKGKGLTWGEEKKKSHQQKMTELAKERQATLMTLNRARESVFIQMLGAMEPAIGVALEEVMKNEGIELILDSKSVIHKMATADVTPMVVEKLNKMNTAAKTQQKEKSKK